MDAAWITVHRDLDLFVDHKHFVAMALSLLGDHDNIFY
jgi:hypothetical protein